MKKLKERENVLKVKKFINSICLYFYFVLFLMIYVYFEQMNEIATEIGTKINIPIWQKPKVNRWSCSMQFDKQKRTIDHGIKQEQNNESMLVINAQTVNFLVVRLTAVPHFLQNKSSLLNSIPHELHFNIFRIPSNCLIILYNIFHSALSPWLQALFQNLSVDKF